MSQADIGGDDEPTAPKVVIPADDPELLQTIESSRATLATLVGTTLDAVAVRSNVPSEAPLLGANVSKLSPLTSTLLESRAVLDLAVATEGGRFQIERQDPGFPDAGVFLDGLATGHGLEIKAYNVLATEITARFRASQLALVNKNIHVVLICWVMDRVIHGQPLILDVQFIEAMSLAKARDAHYNRPPNYVVSPPDDNRGRIGSMLLRNVEGHVLQPSTTAESLGRVRVIQEALLQGAALGEPHHEVTAELTRHLRANLTYRLDTNFAKLDRIQHHEVESAKARNLGRLYLGRTFADWRAVLRGMTSRDQSTRRSAMEAVNVLY